MGLFFQVVVQGVVTLVVIGALKREGIASLDYRRIENTGVRAVLESGVQFGETVAEQCERVWTSFTRK